MRVLLERRDHAIMRFGLGTIVIGRSGFSVKIKRLASSSQAFAVFSLLVEEEEDPACYQGAS